MPPTSSSWLDASSFQTPQHLFAAVGIVACLSAAVGAMVAVRFMRGRGNGNGNGYTSDSVGYCSDSEITDIRRVRRRSINYNSIGIGSQLDACDQTDAAASTAAAAAAAASAKLGETNLDLGSAMECPDSFATDITAYTTSSTTTFSRSFWNEDNSSQSAKQTDQRSYRSSSHIPPIHMHMHNRRNSHAAVHFRTSEYREGEENANDYPYCECACSACSSCIAKGGGGITGDGGNVLHDNEIIRHRRRRRYAQNRPSSLTSESAFEEEDRSTSLHPLNNQVDESTMLSGGGDGGGGGTGAHFVDYSPQTTAHSLEKQLRRANKVQSYISETELKFKGQEEFDELILSAAEDSDSLLVLRRTRAVSALANRLMTAPDEAFCLEEVTRLMILMFDLEKVTFAMLTGSEHFNLKRIIAKPRKGGSIRLSTTSASSTTSSSADFDLYCLDSDDKRPLEGTAAGVCSKTLKEHYTPQTRYSPFATHRVFYEKGYNTVLVTPILVNGNKWAGCILLSKQATDAFKKSERVIISDIGLLLGANIYAKRLLKEADESKKRSREMLHSFIPPKVLQKIECYWDSSSEEYKNARSHHRNDSSYSSTSTPPGGSSDGEKTEVRTNSWYVAQTDWPEPKHHDASKDGGNGSNKKRSGVEKRIEFLRKLNSGNSDGEDDTVGVIVKRSQPELLPTTTRALYAEAVKDVCIIFTDIVGFSAMSMHLSPIKIMDMLQNLYSRFDELCDVHGVLKLETIGDAYICATNLMEEQDSSVSVRNAAIRALAMAKDMVLEAVNTQLPKFSENEIDDVEDKSNSDGVPSSWTTSFETLEIRVGIHIGDVMCGVLGQRLPKFTTCGKAVNMAARMEQTSQSNRIRVTKDFHDLVGDAETGWFEKEVIPLKNMGDMETYLLDPLELRINQ